MLAQSLKTHTEYRHGVYKSFLLNQELPVDVPHTTYHAYLPQLVNRLYSPVPGCTRDLANKSNHRKHFVMQHPESLVYIPNAVCSSKYKRCGLQVMLKQQNQGDTETQLCHDLEAWKFCTGPRRYPPRLCSRSLLLIERN